MELEVKEHNYIYKKDLEEDGFNKITKFIKDEIVHKEFKCKAMFETGYKVVINYKGKTKEIINNKEINDKAEEIIDSLPLANTESEKDGKIEFNNKIQDEQIESNKKIEDDRIELIKKLEDEQRKFDKKLDEIRKDAIIQVRHWGGLGKNAGHGGMIVTNDKSIYTYQHYRNPIEGKKANSIDKKDLTEEEFSKITKFIEDEIANKELESVMMLDGGSTVEINYKGITKEIENNREIYAKAEEIMNTLLEN